MHRLRSKNMTVEESKNLKKGTRVYWRGDASDSGVITETSWDAVTIAWNNGKGGQRAPRRYARNSLRAGQDDPTVNCRPRQCQGPPLLFRVSSARQGVKNLSVARSEPVLPVRYRRFRARPPSAAGILAVYGA